VTISEAFGAVADMLTDLNLRDAAGEPMVGMAAFPAVSKINPEGWTEAEAILENAKPKEWEWAAEKYVERATQLVDEFRMSKFHRDLDRKLAHLVVIQGGAGA
jgi:hypothetical protein